MYHLIASGVTDLLTGLLVLDELLEDPPDELDLLLLLEPDDVTDAPDEEPPIFMTLESPAPSIL
jgi:hypothetical protein